MGEEKIDLMAEMRTSYAELVTSYDELLTSCGQFVAEILSLLQRIINNLKNFVQLARITPSICDILTITRRKKMSNYLKLKNRVMCLKISGGVWGGCLPIASLV